jgi:hypothetical protein
MLDETPDEQGDQQDQAKHLNALRAFEKQGIDDLIVLEKAEVSLDRVLLLIGPENLLGVVTRGALALDIGQQHEATSHFPAPLDGLLVGQDLGGKSVFNGNGRA